jgi:hypothetical protein
VGEIGRRDADARVTHDELGRLAPRGDGDVDAPARHVVVDRVGEQIGRGGHEELGVARDGHRRGAHLH